MAQPRLRKTKYDGTLKQQLPPDMDELLGRIDRLERKVEAERSGTVAAH